MIKATGAVFLLTPGVDLCSRFRNGQTLQIHDYKSAIVWIWMKTKYRIRGKGGPAKPLSTYYVTLPMCYYKWLLQSRQSMSQCSELVNVCIKPRQPQLKKPVTLTLVVADNWVVTNVENSYQSLEIKKKISRKRGGKHLHGLTSLYRLRFLFSGNLATLHGSSHDCWRISCGKMKTAE